MEEQTLLDAEAPSQRLRLEMRSPLCGVPSFNERLPLDLRHRLSDAQFAAPIQGINKRLGWLLVLRAFIWLSALSGIASIAALALRFVLVDKLVWLYLLGCTLLLFTFFMAGAIGFTFYRARDLLVEADLPVLYPNQLNYSINVVLSKANEFYHCHGISFWMEGSYCQWVLVIDVRAVQSGAFADLRQHQQPPDFPYAYSSTVNPTTNSPAAAAAGAYQPYLDHLAD